MHTLLIILIVLLVILVILLGIVAFVALSAFFAVQPILNQLGKISMIIEAAEFIKRRVRKAVLRRQYSARDGNNHHRRGEDHSSED